MAVGGEARRDDVDIAQLRPLRRETATAPVCQGSRFEPEFGSIRPHLGIPDKGIS
jgi:hypothetical protein